MMEHIQRPGFQTGNSERLPVAPFNGQNANNLRPTTNFNLPQRHHFDVRGNRPVMMMPANNGVPVNNTSSILGFNPATDTRDVQASHGNRIAAAASPVGPWQPQVNGVLTSNVQGVLREATAPLLTSASPFPQQYNRPPMSSSDIGLQNAATAPVPGGVPPAIRASPLQPGTGIPPGSGRPLFPAPGPSPLRAANPIPPPQAGMQYRPAGLPPPPVMRIQAPQPPPAVVSSVSPALPVTPAVTRPHELPAPFDGQRQYSHQINAAPTLTDSSGRALTPGSETASQKSSRVPSPIATQNYDDMEGQFVAYTPAGSAALGAVSSPAAMYVTPAVAPSSAPLRPSLPPPPTDFLVSNTTSSAPYIQGQTPSSGIPAFGFRPKYPPSSSAAQGTTPVPTFPVSSAAGGRTLGTPATVQSVPTYTPSDAAAKSPSYPAAPPPPSSQYPTMQSSASKPASVGPGVGLRSTPATTSNYSASTLTEGLSSMHLQDQSRPLNLLQERNIITVGNMEMPFPNLPQEFKKINCNPEIMCCTLNSVPSTQSLLNKCRLPLGLLLHPFKDLSQLPVIQSSVIVRCRSCRTYINPFVTLIDIRRWKCNLCFRANELPDEFSFDPVSKTYGEPHRRPEIRSSTIEFIAPSEYMLRPPQPAVYVFLLDVSFNAIETGYLSVFCRTLLNELDRLPGDSRTQIGFIAFDSALYFYGLDASFPQPKMFILSDLDEVFLPCPDGLLVNLNESKEMVVDFLSKLPVWFEKSMQTGSALGPALQAAYKLLNPTGGRITVIQTQLPTVGAGALKSREEPDDRLGKKIHHLSPVTDFYKKLSLDCSAQQIAVDMFMLNTQYTDIATVAGVSKYSGGTVHYFPGFHSISNPAETEHFESTLHRYLTRKIGFEAVMRIRCTKGLSIHTFHGNFFVRSTDLLSLPNISPDAGFGVQVSIEDTLDVNYVSFQAALLYTSSKAERRIRVHTLCLPVTSTLSEVFLSANQYAIVGLLSKMAVDKSLSSSLSDARDALINAVVDMLTAYHSVQSVGQSSSQLLCPYQLRHAALCVLAMLKSTAFRVSTNTKLDDRIFAMEQCKTLPVNYLIQSIYPDLYPVHALNDKDAISQEDKVIVNPPRVPLSSAHIDRHGAYLMDTGSHMYLWIGAAVSDQFCLQVLDCDSYQSMPETMYKLPDIENETIDRLYDFIYYLNEQRPFPATLIIMKEHSKLRGLFLQHLVEDRTESSLSYNEFLIHIQKEMKS